MFVSRNSWLESKNEEEKKLELIMIGDRPRRYKYFSHLHLHFEFAPLPSNEGIMIIYNVCIYIYPLCGETLEPLARFVRKLPKDSNLAEDSFPGLINQEFLGSFSTDKSICSA
jgi:hypothetical protein